MVPSLLTVLLALGFTPGLTIASEHSQRDVDSNLRMRQDTNELTAKRCVDASVIQLASNLTGQEEGTPGAKSGQARSAK
jgi:hypothetical protein